MSQYKTGTASVSKGSSVVTGKNTLWLANVAPGHGFKIQGEKAVYTVNAVNGDGALQISPPYAGSDKADATYLVWRDFTVNLGLYEPSGGDTEWPFLLTQAMRKLDSVLAGSPSYSSPFGVITLCGLDNGANLPGVALQAEIDRLLDSGVAPEKIIWFSAGTETGSTGTGAGTLTGVSAATSVGTITGAGVTSAGTGALTGVSAATSTGTIGGVGMSDGTGLGIVSPTSVTISAGQIGGGGIALGLADVTGVSTTISAGTITGSGNATNGTGSLTGVSAATSVGTIDSNAAPYSTVSFSGFYEPVTGTADLTGVSATTSTGTITGVGISPNGTGSLTGVSAATSVAAIGSNAAPYSTVTFSNFS